MSERGQSGRRTLQSAKFFRWSNSEKNNLANGLKTSRKFGGGDFLGSKPDAEWALSDENRSKGDPTDVSFTPNKKKKEKQTRIDARVSRHASADPS